MYKALIRPFKTIIKDLLKDFVGDWDFENNIRWLGGGFGKVLEIEAKDIPLPQQRSLSLLTTPTYGELTSAFPGPSSQMDSNPKMGLMMTSRSWLIVRMWKAVSAFSTPLNGRLLDGEIILSASNTPD
eukprot:GHVN01033781.1.p1 GENE.GHVN01033781.1~~GHVN01033781.1.p1  ORF type:complete len:128 (+),score=13.57 GHVN01033781.1:784-1167(+)